jgi:hypothetical protein
MSVMNPPSRPSQAHWRGVLANPPLAGSRVASQPRMNAATTAIDGACVMLGSFTMYQIMNDPVTVSAVAMAASRRSKRRAAIR